MNTATQRTRAEIVAEMGALDDLERVTNRSAGRWCAECAQHGSHHTDRHGEFVTYRDQIAAEYTIALADDGRPVSIDERRQALREQYEDVLFAEDRPIPNEPFSADEPRYDVEVDVTGVGASTGAVMGAVSRALEKARVAPEEVDRFRASIMSGTYDHALAVAASWAYLRLDFDDDF